MRLCVRTMAITFGLFWAVAFLFIAGAQQVWPTYGVGFLELMAGLYPGYAPGGFGSVIMGSLYALLDGAIAGGLFAWLHNMILGSKTP